MATIRCASKKTKAVKQESVGTSEKIEVLCRVKHHQALHHQLMLLRPLLPSPVPCLLESRKTAVSIKPSWIDISCEVIEGNAKEYE